MKENAMIKADENSSQSLFDQANDAWDRGENEKAFELLNLAANQGEIYAYNTIGYFLDEGVGVPQNKDMALLWYKKAAKNKDICAFMNIGVWYRNLGNVKRASYWFLKALHSGDGDAAIALAKICIDRGTKQSRAQAVKYLNISLVSDNVISDTHDEARRILKQINS
ncbi:tetratricopeptide repeat protein [Undibacterium sp. Tian12W]|uniref:tetratricopeptide repeat protein n=1 Tax=Undibacterium sp. Tian12W TaxID=3413054 RepID=UPI003BF2AFFC